VRSGLPAAAMTWPGSMIAKQNAPPMRWMRGPPGLLAGTGRRAGDQHRPPHPFRQRREH